MIDEVALEMQAGAIKHPQCLTVNFCTQGGGDHQGRAFALTTAWA